MAALDTPIVIVVHGEGGSGGALGIAIGDRILMHEFAIYSVIPPEGCAAILWRDSNRKVDAAQALKLTSPDLLRFGIIDQIVREPSGGAHTNHDLAARLLDEPLSRALSEVSAMNPADRLEARYRKFRVMGNIGIKKHESRANLGSPLRRSPRGRRRTRAGRVAGYGAVVVHPRTRRPRRRQAVPLPSLDDLHDPFRLADMAPAVDRIQTAIARRERVAIHGDYDVDGVTSTVILRRALELLGADVVHYIPERLRDGYGLQPAALERLHADGVRPAISVDCGIRADEAARHAAVLGLDLIITDHHEPDASLPPALAVINPKRHDCTYPDKNLAGVGVALKLVQALCHRAGRTGWLPAFVKIAAIGTLADVVPLIGENRVIAKLGLAMLTTGPHKIGLRACSNRAA